MLPHAAPDGDGIAAPPSTIDGQLRGGAAPLYVAALKGAAAHAPPGLGGGVSVVYLGADTAPLTTMSRGPPSAGRLAEAGSVDPAAIPKAPTCHMGHAGGSVAMWGTRAPLSEGAPAGR